VVLPGAWPTHRPPLWPRQSSSNFTREQEEGIELRGLLYTPHPSCCHCQATATGKCQGANLRREKGGPASLRSAEDRALVKETRGLGGCFASRVLSSTGLKDVKEIPNCRMEC
jgi:hypothetical protein